MSMESAVSPSLFSVLSFIRYPSLNRGEGSVGDREREKREERRDRDERDERGTRETPKKDHMKNQEMRDGGKFGAISVKATTVSANVWSPAVRRRRPAGGSSPFPWSDTGPM